MKPEEKTNLKLSQKKVRQFWRKFFRSYFIGDRVSIPNYGRRGTIINKVWVQNHWEYEVEFDHYMRLPKEYFPGEKKRCYGFSGIRYEDMKFIR